MFRLNEISRVFLRSLRQLKFVSYRRYVSHEIKFLTYERFRRVRAFDEKSIYIYIVHSPRNAISPCFLIYICAVSRDYFQRLLVVRKKSIIKRSLHCYTQDERRYFNLELCWNYCIYLHIDTGYFNRYEERTTRTINLRDTFKF